MENQITKNQIKYIDEQIADIQGMDMEDITNDMREQYVIDTLNEGYDDWETETGDEDYQLYLIDEMLDKLEERGVGHSGEIIDDVLETFNDIHAGKDRDEEINNLAEDFRFWEDL